MQTEDFVRGVRTLAVSVDAFHQRFDIPQIDMSSVDTTLDALRQRLSLLDEEVGEHARALNRGEIDEGRERGGGCGLHRVGDDSQAGNGRCRRMPRGGSQERCEDAFGL